MKYTAECEICGKEYTDKSKEQAEKKAKDCLRTHDIVYVPLTRLEVQNILSFILTGNHDYLTERIMSVLRQYRRLH